jgi:flagellar basal body-associated protein FliL
MKTSYIWTIVVVVLVCANSVILFMMWNQRRHEPHPIPPRLETHMEVKDFLIKELALTPKQTVVFDTLRSRHHKTMDSLNKKTHQLKDSLFGYLSKPANGVETKSIIKQIGTNSALEDELTFSHFQKLRGILDAPQQNKFDSIIMQVLHMMAHQGPPPPHEGRSRRHHGPPNDNLGNMHQGPPDGMPPGEGPDGKHHGPPPGGPDGRPPGPPPGGGPGGPPGNNK